MKSGLRKLYPGQGTETRIESDGDGLAGSEQIEMDELFMLRVLARYNISFPACEAF